ncbi:conserved domain protein [Prevotella denticola CRIS 18C-A]|uniref:Conserved domain protein n=1 Tax=Prevotella denticola CRIS 18C-A TaxID=944557 RepID=F0H759_9BACT|nr:conserved domain protein [Prevotella denticola CRIS 18C-A]
MPFLLGGCLGWHHSVVKEGYVFPLILQSCRGNIHYWSSSGCSSRQNVSDNSMKAEAPGGLKKKEGCAV